MCFVRVLGGRDKKLETMLFDKLAKGRANLAETLKQGTFSYASPALPSAKIS